jgi:type III restriction enzyme
LKIILRDFQFNIVEQLYDHARAAKREAEEGREQALVLASPTGSGKTMIATALMEHIVEGVDDHAPDEEAVFLWLTDQPDLNEQSRRKILAASSNFGPSDLVTIESDFDEERFAPGKVYFLNIQKLGRGNHLVTSRDDRQFTIWETVSNTVAAERGSFWLVLDEAHKGMLEGAEAKQAATIVQKFIKGSLGEIPAIPLILGISATPDRFVELLKGTARTERKVPVRPEDVRASGLLKETLVLYHPTDKQPSDWSLLRASAAKVERYAEQWSGYCEAEGETMVDPVLVVQVEDAGGGNVTKTDLVEALGVLEDVLGPLNEQQVAHCFQEGHAIDVGQRALRYISPADIQDDAALRVVFFKLSLNTGWDCPRAEVIMSFRRAVDYTRIAQLVGRLVRTPLARNVVANDFLNSVSLYLPHYDAKALTTVVDYLTKPETGLAAAPDIVDGENVVELRRDEDKAELFQLAETLPTYSIERVSKASTVRRLLRLGRALAYDKLDGEAIENFRALAVSTLDNERKRLEKTRGFKRALKERAEIDVHGVTVRYGVEGIPEESYEAVPAVRQNIDDLYVQCGRKLGEGLHVAYLKARIAATKGSLKPVQAKLELATLLDDEKTIKTLEENAGARYKDEIEKHKAAIRQLTEARSDVYRKLRRQAANPEPEDLRLPQAYEAPRGKQNFTGHIYVDDRGGFNSDFNDWETSVIKAELERDDVVGWLRNVPRKSWALTVPYGEDHPMYPDFLFFRRLGAGIVVDILEPHSLSHADSAPKAQALANFALHEGQHFGRIELIIKDKGKLLRLDVNEDGLRDKVRIVADSRNLRELFESAQA